MARPYDAAKAADDARQAMTKDEHSCPRVRSEAVDGQPAELYRVQSKTATGGSDSQIWISTASGLPLRQTVAMLEQGTVKLKHEVRSDYTNVCAPAGLRLVPLIDTLGDWWEALPAVVSVRADARGRARPSLSARHGSGPSRRTAP